MKPASLAGLIVAGALAIGGGWYFGSATTPTQQRAIDAGALMFPDLAPKLRDAARIEVVNKGKTTVLNRAASGQWGIADRGGYRLQDSKLRAMLTSLTELRLIEARTADAEQYARLGVEDAESANAGSNRLRVLNAAGQPIVDVIVGHRRVRTQGKVPEQVYVRRPGEAQTWLAEGYLQADADPQLWLDRDVVNIEHKRVSGVVSTRGSDVLIFGQEDGKLVLTSPTDHPRLEDYKVEDVARALESLTFQDVRPDADAPGEEIGQAVFTLTDGMTVAARVLRADKDIWVRFAVTATEDKAKPDAERLAQRLGGWSYQVGSWKEKAFVPTIEDLKAAEKPEPEPEPTAEPAKP